MAKSAAKPEKNEAIAVTSGAEKGTCKGLTCWKCGGTGHKRKDCKNKKKDSGEVKTKVSGSANAVETLLSNNEFAFAVHMGSPGESASDVSNIVESDVSCTATALMDNDWFSKVDEEELTDAEIDKN